MEFAHWEEHSSGALCWMRASTLPLSFRMTMHLQMGEKTDDNDPYHYPGDPGDWYLARMAL